MTARFARSYQGRLGKSLQVLLSRLIAILKLSFADECVFPSVQDGRETLDPRQGCRTRISLALSRKEALVYQSEACVLSLKKEGNDPERL